MCRFRCSLSSLALVNNRFVGDVLPEQQRKSRALVLKADVYGVFTWRWEAGDHPVILQKATRRATAGRNLRIIFPSPRLWRRGMPSRRVLSIEGSSSECRGGFFVVRVGACQRLPDAFELALHTSPVGAWSSLSSWRSSDPTILAILAWEIFPYRVWVRAADRSCRTPPSYFVDQERLLERAQAIMWERLRSRRVAIRFRSRRPFRLQRKLHFRSSIREVA